MTLGEKIQQLSSVPDLSKIVMLSELFSITTDELIKENVIIKQSIYLENSNDSSNRKKNSLESEQDVNRVIQDKLLDDYIGKVCSVDLTRWNDGVNNAYMTSYDNNFIYYIITEKNKCKIGALGKEYISQIEIEEGKSLEIPRNYQTQEVNKEFFVSKNVNVHLDNRYFWSGIIGEDTEYLDITVRKFDDDKLYVCENVNEFAILIRKISKLETVV